LKGLRLHGVKRGMRIGCFDLGYGDGWREDGLGVCRPLEIGDACMG